MTSGRQRSLSRAALLGVLLLGTASSGVTGAKMEVPGIDPETVLGPVTEKVDLGSYPVVRYVAVTGSDTKGDGTRANPWATPVSALAKIQGAGPARRVAVLVGAGTYPVRALRLKPHVDLYGSFAGNWERRDLAAAATILDAGGKDRLLIGADHARLDGFTLRRGRVAAHGGAVLCDRTSPTLTNNRFEDNATLESPKYLRGVFHQVGTEGGAIACLNYASPRIEGNTFDGNFTEMGGGGAIAMRCDSVRPREEVPGPVISRNVFIGNFTGKADTAPDVKKRLRTSNGGALSLSNYLAEITHNLFLANRAGGNGDAGGIYCEYEASPRIAHNHFLANRAEDDGAAIYSMKLSEPVIEANVFAGNVGGGSIRVSKQGRARIAGNLLFANPAGGIFSGDSWAVVENNVIMDNGGAGFGHQIQVASYLRPPLVRGNVIRGNQAGEIRAEGTEPATIEGNNIRGGYMGAGNVDHDPRRDTAVRKVAVTGARYDARTGCTTVQTTASGLTEETLRGRVVRCGPDHGLLVRASGGQWMVLGKFDSQPAQWEVLGSYLPLAR